MSFRCSSEAGAPVPLQTIFLHVTKACNLRCSYCYFSASKSLPGELSTQEFQALWPDVVAVRPRKVVFTGGEPLLRPDLFELLQALKQADPEHHVLRCVNTNGHLINRETAQRLVGLADEVRVSLDAMRERNDRFRGEGNYDCVMQALDHLQSVGFEPKVLVTVSSATVPDLEELVSVLLKKAIRHINVSPVRAIGRAFGDEKLEVAWQEVEQALQRARPNGSGVEQVLSRAGDTQSHCGAGHFLNIMPQGDVFPCHVLVSPEFRCGNIREQRLTEICARTGLLGTLTRLDFHALAKADDQLAALTRTGTCLGPVYAASKALPIWRDVLGSQQPTAHGCVTSENLESSSSTK